MSQVVLVLGNDISTDDIYPGRYMATVLPSETPAFCFANRTDFNERLKTISPGCLIVAGENFGCGSSREQAVSTLKGHGLVIVAKSIARIFLQNAINLGLELILCPEIEAAEGDELELTEGRLINKSRGKSFPIQSIPPARQAILDAGGLIAYTRQRMLEGTRG